MVRALQAGISWAGLFAGPIAWGLSTQANYSLVGWQCTHRFPLIPLLALLLALLSIAGGLLSWQAWKAGGAAFKPEREEGTERFLAMVGMLAAALFALVIVMQGAASLILGSCIR